MVIKYLSYLFLILLSCNHLVTYSLASSINNPIVDTKTVDNDLILNQATKLLKNKIILDYEKDTFNDSTDPWTLYSLSLNHHFSWGSLITRGNFNHRFNTYGRQIEVDAYPHLRDGTYMYLNYGHSDSTIFPKNRFGAEVYQNVGGGYELSLGIRKLWFGDDEINIYTGTIAKYLGNYYFFFHPYYTPSNVGASKSGTFGLRRYLDDEQYVAMAFGSGLSISQNSNLEVIKLDSKKASLDAYLKAPHDVFIHPAFSYAYEEVREDVFRKKIGLDLAVEIRF